MQTPNYELEGEDTRVEALIGGRFRLVSILGEGGMGTVYLAKDRGVAPIALKVMKPELEASPRARQRFLRECELLKRIESPHVVRVYDSGTAPAGELYLAMELLDGCPLGDRIKDEGAFASFVDVAAIGEQIALGVAAAHALDVVHRDLKPDNVFLTADGGLRVLDFGIARLVDPPHLDRGTGRLTSTGAILGTPAYISPEAAAGEPVEASADLYSLGVMLFEMVTGRLPFEADLPLVMMTKHLTEDAPKIRDVRADTPVDLAALIDLMLDKEPEARPSSALAVARELARLRAADDELLAPTLEVTRTAPIELVRPTVAARPPREPEPEPEPESGPSRWPLVAVLAALFAAALVGVGLWASASDNVRATPIEARTEPSPPPELAVEELAVEEPASVEAPSVEEPSVEAPPTAEEPARPPRARRRSTRAGVRPPAALPEAEAASPEPSPTPPPVERAPEPPPSGPRPGELIGDYGS